jgi:hypothetical protein
MPKDRPPRQPGERSELDCRRDVETRAKRGERDASRATPEDVQRDSCPLAAPTAPLRA